MTSVGILANPAAARDVRRLVAKASSVSIAERCMIIQRAMVGLGKMGVTRTLMMLDHGGIAAGLKRAILHQRRDDPLCWPELEFLEMPVTGDAEDTPRAVGLMRERGVKVIIVLGGDGTHRLVAHACGNIPLVCISTGTNNVFPESIESTIAGIAAGAVALGKVPAEEVCRRNKRLCMRFNGIDKIPALVDICVTSENWVATRALWRPDDFRELFLAFAEPGAIGLSSIGSLFQPVSRDVETGLAVELNSPTPAIYRLEAPIAPGMIVPVGIKQIRRLLCRKSCRVQTQHGTIALDGEKEIEFFSDDKIEITLDEDGPLTVIITKVMEKLAKNKNMLHKKFGASHMSGKHPFPVHPYPSTRNKEEQ